MKRYIHPSTNIFPKVINIVVEAGWFDDGSGAGVAAATFNGKELPKGPLLPAEKDAIITSQMLEDYRSFISSVEELLTDYYKLHVYYKNNSEDNSFYFGIIAKNSDGSPVLEFNFTLRVSNHPAHRSPQSKEHKKEQKAELKKLVPNVDLKPLTKSILVNDKEFNNYEEAYEAVDKIIESVVNIMTRKKK